MASSTVLSLLTFLSVVAIAASQTASPPPQQPPQALFNAAEALSNSGYLAMSLTLQLLLTQPQPLLPLSATTALTIFAPPDSAFIASGQPSLSLLLLHFSPLSLSLQSLLSLPFSTTIPTLSPTSTTLHITTSLSDTKPRQISINNVKLNGSPLYDDASIVIFAVDSFFNPNFTLVNPKQDSSLKPQCVEFSNFSRYVEASAVLKSRGYSIMASFLELQLIGFVGSASVPGTKFTVFAPFDEAIQGFSGNFLVYKPLFFKHFLPCTLSWSELNGIENETMFGNFVEGYNVKITRSDDNVVMVNGVKISSPDMYKNDWIVVHGVQELIAMPESIEEQEEKEEKTPSKVVENDEQERTEPNYGEF